MQRSNLRSAFTKVFTAARSRADGGNCLRVALLETPLGAMLAAVNHDAVCHLDFADPHGLERSAVEMQRRFCLPAVPGENAVTRRLRVELGEYFRGERRNFTVPVAPRGTAFQQRVWRELQRIPYGQTASYADMARRVGSPAAVRAVGQANKANPLCLLAPCHRVIAKDGTIGGYGGGVWRKRWLLELERTGSPPAIRTEPPPPTRS